jgi:hypothetical protein
VRPYSVEFVDEGVEAALLLQAVLPWRVGALQDQMRALTAAVLVQPARLDVLDRDASSAHTADHLGAAMQTAGVPAPALVFTGARERMLRRLIDRLGGADPCFIESLN